MSPIFDNVFRVTTFPKRQGWARTRHDWWLLWAVKCPGAQILKHLLEAEKSTSRNSCLFKGHRVQQSSYRLLFLLNDLKIFISILTDLKMVQMPIIKCSVIKNIITIKLKPCTRTFRWIAFQKCVRIRALDIIRTGPRWPDNSPEWKSEHWRRRAAGRKGGGSCSLGTEVGNVTAKM
jgi:hypothetical protein